METSTTKSTALNQLQLFKKIPVDVFMNHILPYTYRVQSKILLMDIRSFYTDYQIIGDIYSTQYNAKILLYDLLNFYKGNNRIQLPTINTIGLEYRAKINKTMNHKRKNRIIWGSLNPIERTRFINNYILIDLEDA